MKNSTRLFCFGGTLILLILLLIPFAGHAQEASAATSGGFFSKVGDWFQGKMFATIVAICGAFFAGSKVKWKIKKVAQVGEVVSRQLEHLSGSVADMCHHIDESIKDDDTLDANNIKEAVASGKEVVADTKDMVIIFKPKPVSQ